MAVPRHGNLSQPPLGNLDLNHGIGARELLLRQSDGNGDETAFTIGHLQRREAGADVIESPPRAGVRGKCVGNHLGRRECVALHQIWPLMSVHAHAMPDAMTEVLVVGTKACIDNHLARRRIHGFTRYTGARRLERRRLRAMFDLEHIFHALRGFAQHEGTRDVAAVAFDLAAAVDEQNASFTHHLRRGAAMWQRRVFAHLHTRRSAVTQSGVRLRHE